jgi:hypothetical protein
MTHLTPDQFVDAVEGRVERHPGAASHLAVCENCRAELSSLTEVLSTARAVDLPEPSPLFWEHFSRRVRAAVESESTPRRAGWFAGAWRPVVLLGAAGGALALVLVLRPSPVSAPILPSSQFADATVAVTPVADVESSDDVRLSVMAAMAKDLEAEEFQQAVRPSADAAGAALEDLTVEQREALVRLIKARMIGAE